MVDISEYVDTLLKLANPNHRITWKELKTITDTPGLSKCFNELVKLVGRDVLKNPDQPLTERELDLFNVLVNISNCQKVKHSKSWKQR